MLPTQSPTPVGSFPDPLRGETDDQAELDAVEMGDQDMAEAMPFTFAIHVRHSSGADGSICRGGG